MRFFVPHAADSDQAEIIRDATRAFLKEQGYSTSDRRIRRAEYRQGSRDFVVEVGRTFPGFSEEVLVMLEGQDTKLLFAATLTRGDPCIILGEDVTSIEDFEGLVTGVAR